jgi:hypothetical protein
MEMMTFIQLQCQWWTEYAIVHGHGSSLHIKAGSKHTQHLSIHYILSDKQKVPNEFEDGLWIMVGKAASWEASKKGLTHCMRVFFGCPSLLENPHLISSTCKHVARVGLKSRIYKFQKN